ncbi:hypothetical protein BAE44_0022120 [Dichanthelium oligosanthes]|uniref:IBH1-like N-terminal domain-containing protein n=1 Tax=Dichanthelium oligosanthes TaxID=888268 RepID=A0A1E5UVM9_9POAL|nr:hypothetical protein BAE44_0022120 [Dichanthelium oligosanthes]
MSTSSPPPDRKRKRRDSDSPSDVHQEAPAPSKWRSPRAQESYSSKLLFALRLVRTTTSGCRSSSAQATGGREVRDAAYRALAVSARGRSRWSRAILARRRRALQRARLVPLPRATTSCGATTTTTTSSSSVASKARVLGRLVPGCRRLSLPALLAEVSDYIQALEMQVRAMNKLAQDLAAAAAASSSTA